MSPGIAAWFERHGWTPFAFQREAWAAIAAGESGLLHARTGAGKTHALWLGAVGAALAAAPGDPWQRAGLKVLWITPMRALASDTVQTLQQSVNEIGLPWTVGLRTGDTASAERARQDRRLPDALVTTPESLSLVLSRADSAVRLASLALVVVDEWHELLGSKRGVQVELALARLRALRLLQQAASQRSARLSVWALSATLGNLDEAMVALLGETGGRRVQGDLRGAPRIDTLMPPAVGRFPWGGHLGLTMLEPVAAEIESAGSTLVFTNTRAQAELWYQSLLQARPQWAGVIALHHGSLDRSVREWVEDGLRTGRLKAVVCTSSLDLGVDFSPVERVIQIGSAKGVARLLQRAGRSGHAPGREPRVTLVPTHALELLEAVAAADAVRANRIEPRHPLRQPIDVLVQHVVTVALGGGFEPEALFAEVRTTYAYRDLSRAQWDWVLDFVRQGGRSLAAYPDFQRVAVDETGVHRMVDRALARRHRLSIGTIVSDSAMQVKWVSGGALGSIEESFIRRLRRGDRFLFAGRTLELVRVHEMTAYVRRSQGSVSAVARWAGGRMPLSGELAGAMLERLAQARQGHFAGEEMRALQPLLAVQASWSCLPAADRLLVECWRSREGEHLFVYPFAGRMANLGLASLVAWRVSRTRPASFSMAVNDYGFELLSPDPVDWSGLRDGSLLALDALAEDVLASLNASELAQRRFREIARVAGLVFTGYPGAGKSVRQLQASSGLYYEVFTRYEPDHLLLDQARREVLEHELELDRLRDTLGRLGRQHIEWVELKRPTPLAFPLLVERLRERLSTETLTDRVARMLADLERAAELTRSR